ncbi:MAG: hypothetical protein OXG61_08155 [Chloroflexi bacterium]|nr:hypothetical protein [Chloroflexota bacterium]
MLPDDTDSPASTTERLATVRDVNDIAEAIMEHVMKEDAALRARLDQVEAETITLRRLVHQLSSLIPPPPRLRHAGGQ